MPDYTQLALYAGYTLSLLAILGALGFVALGKRKMAVGLGAVALMSFAYLNGASVLGLSSPGLGAATASAVVGTDGDVNCGDVQTTTVTTNVWNISNSAITRATATVNAVGDDGAIFDSDESSCSGGAANTLSCCNHY